MNLLNLFYDMPMTVYYTTQFNLFIYVLRVKSVAFKYSLTSNLKFSPMDIFFLNLI